MTNHGVSNSPREMGAETTANVTAMDGPTAERLFKANRLRDLIGVGAMTQPTEVKAACRKALLTHHPDKGGDAEVFKWVRPATEALLLEENLYTFDGSVPTWAKMGRKRMEELRIDIATFTTQLDAANSTIGEAHSPDARAWGQQSARVVDVLLKHRRTLLKQELTHFKTSHLEHVRLQRLRQEEVSALEAKVVAEWALSKRQYEGVVAIISRRHQRGRGRFPRMPGAVTDQHARFTLGGIQANYLKVISTTRKRAKRGVDIADLESKSHTLLLEAHTLVDQCCNNVHARVVNYSRRFPVLPKSDPRSLSLAKLNKEQRLLTQRIKPNTSDGQLSSLNARISSLFDQAVAILGYSEPVSMAD
jgi:hypothetical protein